MKKLLFTIFSLIFIYTFSYGQNYDLVIKNGHIIDKKNNIDFIGDIGISNGIIKYVGEELPINSSRKIINAESLIVVPGLIDIHSHNFHGTIPNRYLSNSFSALPPDGFSFRSGITTIVDVGGAGWKNFEVFKEQVIEKSKTRVLAFLNIIGLGMQGGEIEQNIDDMDAMLTAEMVNKYPEHIVGIKLAHFNGYNWIPVDKVTKAGELSDRPVMIDFGGSNPLMPLDSLLLHKLRPGDIFTHTYANVRGRMSIVDGNNKLHDFVKEAQNKGIIFDVGHGGGSFAFSQAIPAINQGLKPNTISTDLHTGSMNGGMKDLLNVMSKFLNMGLSLNEVITSVTWDAAKSIKKENLGNLSVGSIADITILNLREGDFGFIDTKNKKMKGTKKLECELTIKDGKIVYDLNGLASLKWDE
ncbi:MAG: amidohydrolase/deacetylase family metallohydrolase [Flavobacteriaceae bacterium]